MTEVTEGSSIPALPETSHFPEAMLMRLDSLARLIEAADFSSFRELVLECLSLRGYAPVELTDGWGDGGSDLKVFSAPPNPTHLAVQTTVQKKWKSKLKKDARKAKSHLGITHLIFATSRRVAEGEFAPISDDIWRDLGVRVSKLDCQGIASTFVDAGKGTSALRLLGIDIGAETNVPTPLLSARSSAAYAFVFFGGGPQRFRERVAESVIITTLLDCGPLKREQLLSVAIRTLSLDGQPHRLINSALDRLLQTGQVLQDGTNLDLSPKERDNALTSAATRESNWHKFQEEIQIVLSEQLKRTLSTEELAPVLNSIGSLLINVAEDAEQAMVGRADKVTAEHTRNGIRALNAALDHLGAKEGTVRSRLIDSLTSKAAASPVARDLIAGHLFSALATTRKSHLLSALGAGDELVLYLETSVAIPLLVTLLFGSVSRPFFEASEHFYRAVAEERFSLLIPSDYVEEAASHLVRAWRDYSSIINLDADLSLSANAYVAHYTSLRQQGEERRFADYVKVLGYRPHLDQVKFSEARDTVIPVLRRLFGQYGIKSQELRYQDARSRKRAEEAVARAVNALKIQRPSVVLRHDAGTIAYLGDREEDARKAHIVCRAYPKTFREGARI